MQKRERAEESFLKVSGIKKIIKKMYKVEINCYVIHWKNLQSM